MYLYVHTQVDTWHVGIFVLGKNILRHAPQGYDTSTVEATSGGVGRGGHDQALRGNSGPRGGPHREET